MKFLKNSLWMIGDYFAKIFSAIFVGVYIARYLGPEAYGMLSYALAIISIFIVISKLGMDSILVRDIANQKEGRSLYVSSALLLMSAIGFLLYIIACAGIYLVENDFKVVFAVWVLAGGILFQSCYVVDYYYQAGFQAKYSAISKSMALLLSSALKIGAVHFNMDFYIVIWLYMIDHILVALSLLICFALKNKSDLHFKIKLGVLGELVRSSWPMVIASLASILYMRVDQVMIKSILGVEELGYYAAAIKIYEGWIIIPMIICISLLPAISEKRAGSRGDYEKFMVRIFSGVFWLGIIASLVAVAFGEAMIELTFGAEFSRSVEPFIIVMLSASFTALGSATARYLVVEGMEKKIATRTLLALCLNVALNYALIPLYGVSGAAFATFMTILFSNYLINYFDSRLVRLRLICNRAIMLKLS